MCFVSEQKKFMASELLKSIINIEIVYAQPQQQILHALQVESGCTVEQAIHLSGLLQRFPEIDLKIAKVGIFSKIVSLATPLREQDRVEIYRPLQIDPKKARLLRAQRAVARSSEL